MRFYETITSIPRDALINSLDLIAFVLITPELIGEARLNLLTGWIKRIFGGQNRTIVIVVALFIAGRALAYLEIPRGYGRFLIMAAVAVLVGVLFTIINRFVKTTSERQVMLVIGAILFVTARLIGIVAAL